MKMETATIMAAAMVHGHADPAPPKGNRAPRVVRDVEPDMRTGRLVSKYGVTAVEAHEGL